MNAIKPEKGQPLLFVQHIKYIDKCDSSVLSAI